MTMRRLAPIALPLVLLSATAAAAPFQNIDALEMRLINALGAGIGEPGGPATAIDRRLKLAACPGSVQIDPPAMGAVALRCMAANWRIRVPIARLGDGQRMTTSGMTMKAEPVVRRGDAVDLIAESTGFSVSVSGIAQDDGAPGARIRIKADGKNAPIFAEVIDAGRVRLPGFN